MAPRAKVGAGLALAAAVLALAPFWISDLGDYPPGDNLALTATVVTHRSVGVPGAILRGPIPPDGETPAEDRALILAEPGGWIRFDFPEPVRVAGFLVQAGADDRFGVSTSEDGENWERAGSIKAAAGGSRLRTRSHAFSEPRVVRSLRIRTRGGARSIVGALRGGAGNLALITAIRVYAELPESWPDAPAARVEPSFPWLGVEALGGVRLAVALVGLGALLVLYRQERRGGKRLTVRRAERVLLAAAAVAGLCWWNLFQFSARDPVTRYGSIWDVYHYYLGAKYQRQVGYFDLYHCVVTADLEDGLGGLQRLRGQIRELRSYDLVDVADVASDPGRCKNGFSDERWREFKTDVAWFRSQVPLLRWLRLQLDHGYNASPAWALLGGSLANQVPLDRRGFALLVSLDAVLLVVLWYAVWRAFGTRAVCVALLFWGTNYLARSWWTLGAFLRQEWLFLSVLAVCCLRWRFMATAGVLVAGATILRIFPGVLALGVALRALAEMLHTRRVFLSRDHRRFAAGALAGLAVFAGLSVAEAGRVGVWKDFVDNTRLHFDHYAGNTSGWLSAVEHVDRSLRRAAAGHGVVAAFLETPHLEHEPETRRDARRLTTALALMALPLLAFAVRRQDDWVAAVLATCWIPFFTDLASYYYAIWLVLGFLVVRRRAVGPGLAILAVVLAALGLIDRAHHARWVFVWSSHAIAIFSIWLLVIFSRPAPWSGVPNRPGPGCSHPCGGTARPAP